MTTTPSSRPARGPRSRFRRRLAGAVALGIGLLAAGGLYTAFAPQPQVATAQGDAALVAKGHDLYNGACITCHGANLQGVEDRGPSLIGVGDAATYFQVSTGRMPLARQEAQAQARPPMPQFDPATPEGAENLDALGAFIASNGGGPSRPAASGEALRGPDPARGGELFRLNCASCHNFAGRGGALSAGKYAPPLTNASDTVIWTAMLSGPQNMPVFSDNQLTTEQKQAITNYVQTLKSQRDPGGSSIGRLGPVPEGLVIWVVGIGAIMLMILWIGAKS